MVGLIRGWGIGLALIVGVACARAEGPATRPVVEIEGEQLSLKLHVPDPENGHYRSTRFDWGSMVHDIRVGGRVLLHEWDANDDPTDPLANAVGLAEDWGSVSPPGWEQAGPGETFIKIGVGRMVRPNEEKFGNGKLYEIVDIGKWTVEKESDRSLLVRHELSVGSDGYGYELERRVVIEEGKPALRVEHVLRNTGTKPIETDWYCHNFINVDGQPVGPGWEVDIAFEGTAEKEAWLHKLAVVDGKTIRMVEVPGPKVAWSPIAGFSEQVGQGDWVVRDGKGLVIEGKLDKPISRFLFFAPRETICPEPIVTLSVPVGGEERWVTSYVFGEEKNP